MKKTWLSKPTSILEKNSHSETGVAFDFEMYVLVDHSMAFPQENKLYQYVSSSAAHAITVSYYLAFVLYKRKQSWQSGRKKEKKATAEKPRVQILYC